MCLARYNQLTCSQLNIQQCFLREGTNRRKLNQKNKINTVIISSPIYFCFSFFFGFVLISGYTHLFLEAVAIATHRQLSPSHPVFRLLAPYLRHVIPVNW